MMRDSLLRMGTGSVGREQLSVGVTACGVPLLAALLASIVVGTACTSSAPGARQAPDVRPTSARVPDVPAAAAVVPSPAQPAVTATTQPTATAPEVDTATPAPAASVEIVGDHEADAIGDNGLAFRKSVYVMPADDRPSLATPGSFDPNTGMPPGVWLVNGADHPLVVLHVQPDPHWAADGAPQLEVIPVEDARDGRPGRRVFSGTVIEKPVERSRLPAPIQSFVGRAVTLEDLDGAVCDSTLKSLSLIMLSNNQPDYFFGRFGNLDDAQIAALATKPTDAALGLWTLAIEHRLLLLVATLSSPDASCKGSVFARLREQAPAVRFARMPDAIRYGRAANPKFPPNIQQCVSALRRLPEHVAKRRAARGQEEQPFEWTGARQWEQRDGDRKLVLVQQGNDWENLWALYETTDGPPRLLAHGTAEKALSPELILDVQGDGTLDILAPEFAFIPLPGLADMISVRTLCLTIDCWG